MWRESIHFGGGANCRIYLRIYVYLHVTREVEIRARCCVHFRPFVFRSSGDRAFDLPLKRDPRDGIAGDRRAREAQTQPEESVRFSERDRGRGAHKSVPVAAADSFMRV